MTSKEQCSCYRRSIAIKMVICRENIALLYSCQSLGDYGDHGKQYIHLLYMEVTKLHIYLFHVTMEI